jgi:hypothetical protein
MDAHLMDAHFDECSLAGCAAFAHLIDAQLPTPLHLREA